MFSIPEMKKVEDVMDRQFNWVSTNETIEKAINKIISSNKKTLIVTNDKEHIEGIVSLKDIQILREKNIEYQSLIVKDIMTKDIVYVNKGVTVLECRNIMINNNIGILPVLEDKKIIGILTQEHIRDYLYMNIENYGITLNHIVGEIKEGICAIDESGTVILWNKFMEERYGIRASEILGNKMNDFLKDTISEKVLHSKVAMSDLYRCILDNEGRYLYGMVQANPIYVEDKCIGVVCTEVDITEAKRLTKELEKANHRLKYLQNEVMNLSKGSFDKILGKSYKLEHAKQIAKQVAKANTSIFIFGESGTGKEVFARAIHEHGNKKGQFIPINCSAIPSELFESEFFGYEPGSFTGASKKGKIGVFELAKNGTIFLDEIADLPLSMQAKLLRVLQENEIRRIGGDKNIKVNARIISATNKNLLDLVKEEKFREDLYYRLNVVEIKLPPLRERKEDIPILIYNFLDDLCKENDKETLNLSKEALKVLERYSWKGNIRELKNTIENLVILSRENIIDVDDIPEYIIERSSKVEEYYSEDSLDLTNAMHKLEKKMILKALEISKGNKAKAAKMLNIPRTTLYYKIDAYEISV